MNNNKKIIILLVFIIALLSFTTFFSLSRFTSQRIITDTIRTRELKINFETNGNNTAAKSHSSVVNIIDTHSNNITDAKYVWSLTNNTNAVTGTPFTNGDEISTDGLNGIYYLCVYALDDKGFYNNSCSNAFVFDNTAPTIIVTLDEDNNVYKKSHNAIIEVVNDAYGAELDSDSFKYVWTKNIYVEPNVAFSNGDTVTKSDGTGSYYVMVTACDTLGNCSDYQSNASKLDNTIPNADVRTEIINGERYAVFDTDDEHSGVDYVGSNDGILAETKEKNLKIYVSTFNGLGSFGATDLNNYAEMLNDAGYTDVTVVDPADGLPTLEYLQNNGYNLLIMNRAVWATDQTLMNQLFAAGINLFTSGDDSDSGLTIIQNSTPISTINSSGNIVGNGSIFANNVGEIIGNSDVGTYIKFIDGTNVFFTRNINGTDYDVGGCYNGNNTKWFHFQEAIGLHSDHDSKLIPAAVDYIANKGQIYFKIPSNDTYTFNVVDKAGNVLQLDYSAQNYTVTLNNQGATTPGTTSVIATYGEMLPNITIPTKNGYTFVGYYSNTTANDLVTSVSDVSGIKRVSFTNSVSSLNGWNMTSADVGTHIQGKIIVTDTVQSQHELQFNDVVITPTKVEHTGNNWIYYIDFNITDAMLSGSPYPYDSTYRFIDVEGGSSSASVSVEYLVRGGKKYYNNSGVGIYPSDFIQNSTLYAHWKANTVTINIKKDGSAWSNSGMKVELYSGTTAMGYTATISSGSSAQLSGAIPNGTYNVYIGKDSNHKTTMIDSGIDVTVNNNSKSATVNYYTLTVQTAGNGTATVNGTSVANNGTVVVAGGTTTTANNYAHAIVGGAASGHRFSSWSAVSGSPTIASTTTASTTVKVGAASTIKVTGTPNTVTITVKKDDSNWNNSGMKFQLRQSNTAKYGVTANTSDASTAVMSGVANGTYDLYASKYNGSVSTFVDTGYDITVSNNNKSQIVNYYTITRSQGVGTTLTTKFDSSSGTAFTNNPVVLGNNRVTIYAKATKNSGYNGTVTLKHGSTSMTASGATFTVSAKETIASGGITSIKTPNIYVYNPVVTSSSATFTIVIDNQPIPTNSKYQYQTSTNGTSWGSWQDCTLNGDSCYANFSFQNSTDKIYIRARFYEPTSGLSSSNSKTILMNPERLYIWQIMQGLVVAKESAYTTQVGNYKIFNWNFETDDHSIIDSYNSYQTTYASRMGDYAIGVYINQNQLKDWESLGATAAVNAFYRGILGRSRGSSEGTDWISYINKAKSGAYTYRYSDENGPMNLCVSMGVTYTLYGLAKSTEANNLYDRWNLGKSNRSPITGLNDCIVNNSCSTFASDRCYSNNIVSGQW